MYGYFLHFLSTPFSRAYFSLKLTLQWFLLLPMLALHEQCNKCVGHRVVVGVLQIEEPQIYLVACKVCVFLLVLHWKRLQDAIGHI